MKLTYITLFVILFFQIQTHSQAQSQKGLYQRLDSTFRYGLAARKEVFLYDSLNRNTERIISSYSNSSQSWYVVAKNVYKYVDGLLLTEYYYQYSSGWKLNDKYEFFYDSNGKDTVKIRYYYNSNNVWQKRFRERFYYDNNGRIDSSITKKWNSGQSQWTGGDVKLFSYNSTGALISMVSVEEDYLFGRNYQNKLVQESYKYFGGTIWEELYKLYFHYNANDDIYEDIFYEWQGYGYGWKLTYKGMITYDTSFLASKLFLPVSYFNHGLGVKDYYFQVHKPLRRLSYMYTNQNTWVLNGDSMIYNYSDIHIGISEISKKINIRICPNPSKSIININGLNDYDNYSVNVYDIRGRKILTKQLATHSFDISSIKTGIYIMEIESKGNIISRKKIIKN